MASNTTTDDLNDETRKPGSRKPPKRLQGEDAEVDEQGEPIKWWWDFGWIRISSIYNNSGNKVTFYNPYEGNEGTIEAGKFDNYYCVGYLPYYDYKRRYEIKYYNKALKGWKLLELKDLGGKWLMSVYQDAKDEDVRDVWPNPDAFKDYSSIGIGINENGYEIYSYTWGKLESRLSWQPI